MALRAKEQRKKAEQDRQLLQARRCVRWGARYIDQWRCACRALAALSSLSRRCDDAMRSAVVSRACPRPATCDPRLAACRAPTLTSAAVPIATTVVVWQNRIRRLLVEQEKAAKRIAETRRRANEINNLKRRNASNQAARADASGWIETEGELQKELMAQKRASSAKAIAGSRTAMYSTRKDEVQVLRQMRRENEQGARPARRSCCRAELLPSGAAAERSCCRAELRSCTR